MRHFTDSFRLFADAQGIAEHLITDCGEFAHLSQVHAPCILSQRALVERGQALPGVISYPSSDARSSAKRNLIDWLIAEFCHELLEGEEPDFLLLFDAALWPKDSHEQEHLCYHLLSHIEQAQDEYGAPKFHKDGRPMLKLRAHDIERFTQEIARYGETIEGIKDERGIYAAARARQLRAVS